MRKRAGSKETGDNKFKVEVTFKPGVLDAEGNAARNALRSLGFKASNVTTAKVFIIETPSSRREVNEMCRKLLANPIIQNYSITEF